jgi:hypothetical protein
MKEPISVFTCNLDEISDFGPVDRLYPEVDLYGIDGQKDCKGRGVIAYINVLNCTREKILPGCCTLSFCSKDPKNN